ncbi:MAG: hypothetical protein KBA60_06080 [Flavobacteriales bacterium]|nr:hypothetical protein [Flavobacteriales bacterium]
MQINKRTGSILAVASFAAGVSFNLLTVEETHPMLKGIYSAISGILFAIPSSYLFLLFTEAWTAYHHNLQANRFQSDFYLQCRIKFNVFIHVNRAMDPNFDGALDPPDYYTDWSIDQISDALDVAVDGQARRNAKTEELIDAERRMHHARIAYSYIELFADLRSLVDIEMAKSNDHTHQYIARLHRFRDYLSRLPDLKNLGFIQSLAKNKQEFDYRARMFDLIGLREAIRMFEVPIQSDAPSR